MRPSVNSGYPYPLPWFLILANIYIHIRFIISIIFDSKLKPYRNAREQEGVEGVYPLLAGRPESTKMIIPSTREVDYPLPPLPKEVISCGGIFLPAEPVAKVDPELDSWLQNGPTVLLSLGSHLLIDDLYSRNIAIGIDMFLRQRPKMQFLWKMKNDISAETTEMLKEHLESGRVRIVRWLEPEPLSVLQSGHIICFIHHGGANSFFEAIRCVSVSRNERIILVVANL